MGPLAAAALVALGSFWLYRATLLPGVDLGDSGSIQTTVGSALLRTRDGYPLYFAIGNAILALTRAEPARAMSMASALEAALACGLFVLVATELSGSIAAAVGGAMLFAVSYTFWSQSVTAEVYALHLVFVLASLGLLLRWQRRPTTARLAAFFACYAAGFGNHLSMILLAPAFTLFLFTSAPGGWRSMFAPRVVALAIGIAAAGSLQYLWNLRTLWFMPQPPESLRAALATFWFDVTKSDWRETMVLNVPLPMVRDHTAMYWFDLRQQFGIVGVAAAAVGLLALTRTDRRRAALVGLIYLANLVFAFSYNVGDTHVFYLPSHLMVALLASVGVTALSGVSRESSVGSRTPSGIRDWRLGMSGLTLQRCGALALGMYAVLRGYRDFPALDRSGDTRAAEVLRTLTAGLDDQRAILLVELNWQLANGLSYFTKAVTPEVATARARDVLLYAPVLVRANVSAGRTVAATEQAAHLLHEGYGPLFDIREETPRLTLESTAGRVAPGTRYVLCVLKPTRDYRLDCDDLARSVRALTGGALSAMPDGDYAVIAGISGEAPSLAVGEGRPLRRSTSLKGTEIEIRMESWLSADTIRRMGFGHVIAGRRHALIVERGISLVCLDETGGALRTAYFASLFEQPQRYLIGFR